MGKSLRYDENDDRFYIKESTIKGAGKGLFARRSIKKGDHIEISGVIVERDSYADKCTTFANQYKFALDVIKLGSGDIVTGNKMVIPLGFSGMVNHMDEEAKRNVQIEYMGNECIAYVFLRDVAKDEEILGNYGDNWQNLLSWMQKQHESNKTDKKDWQNFLELDLYDLGRLL